MVMIPKRDRNMNTKLLLLVPPLLFEFPDGLLVEGPTVQTLACSAIVGAGVGAVLIFPVSHAVQVLVAL